MIGAWITAGGAIIVALVTFILTSWTNRRQGALQAQLTRVNLQLANLYGPLLALTRSNSEVWSTFFERHRVSPADFLNETPVGDAQRRLWIEWMQTVFMPSNRKIVQLIENRTDLLEDDSMPEVLMKFYAHAAGFEVTLKRWQDGDYSLLTSVINHPGSAMSEYAVQSFALLKIRQRELLEATSRKKRMLSGVSPADPS